jgi:hypothetical protein
MRRECLIYGVKVERGERKIKKELRMRRDCLIYGVKVERRERKRNGCVREEERRR